MNSNTKKIDSYLSFKLGEEEFATNVEKVISILEMTNITAVPKAPEYMKGVINLRGTVLPIIDTRLKLGMSPSEYSNNTCIVVLDIELNNENIKVGALVDSVQEVLELESDQIKLLPSLGSKYKSEFIKGVVGIENKFIMILNMDSIFSTEEISITQSKTEEITTCVE